MAGRRTIDRKGQRGEFEEEPVKVEAEEVEEDDDDDDEDEDGEEEAEADGEAEAEAPVEDAEAEADDDDDEDAPKKKKKAKPKKKAPAVKRVRAAKKAIRQKAVWVLYDNSSKTIETFPFSEREAANKLLVEKSEDAKKGYYLQKVKVPLEENEKEK